MAEELQHDVYDELDAISAEFSATEVVAADYNVADSEVSNIDHLASCDAWVEDGAVVVEQTLEYQEQGKADGLYLLLSTALRPVADKRPDQAEEILSALFREAPE